ncbi:MAG: hypothetical protein HY822_11020 [Acidobacteria bacterium]|nr:hypothetical protein [Acidobacteriota bacterium]
MSSLKQIRANQKNGRLSNGPTTPEGLAASSQNALKHGLCSRSVLLPEEDPDAFHELFASLQIEHRPVGAHVEYLVRQMAVSQWRMDRLQRIEAGLLASRLEIIREYEADSSDEDDEDDKAPPDPGQEYLETTRQLGAAFYDDSRAVDSFSKLSRYEATIRRGFYKALEQLRRAQARRLHLEKNILQNEPNLAPHHPSGTPASSGSCVPPNTPGGHGGVT